MTENSNKIFNTAVGFSLVGILILTILIFQQLSTANDLNKVNLTYKIYDDMTKTIYHFMMRHTHLNKKTFLIRN
jgi:hypothetical protein